MPRFALSAAIALGCLVASAAAAGIELDRSPVDLAISRDGRVLAVANQTSDSVSLVDLVSGQVVDELSLGDHPVAIVAGGANSDFWLSCRDDGMVYYLMARQGKLSVERQVAIGYHPLGMVWNASSNTLWVAQRAAKRVVELDGKTGELRRSIEVGTWPERLALSPLGDKLAVTLAGSKGIALVDLVSGRVHRRTFRALNQGQPCFSPDGTEVWLPWMVYRANPINEANIRRGWIWGSRLGRIALDDSTARRVLTLDQRGRAVADVADMAFVAGHAQVVITAAGTHELLWLKLASLPWREYAATDHMDARLIADRSRFRRIELGGRPLGVATSLAGDVVYVANYLRNSVQVVSLKSFAVSREIDLGGASSPSLARRGAAIFYDARRSLDQWYSCHTCHLEGGTNAVATDTLNDGTSRTFKTIPPLFDLPRTGPWTWHGWQRDLSAAMHKSLTSTMLGEAPTNEDVAAMLAFFAELKRPVTPYSVDDRRNRDAIERGKEIFAGETAACAECHSGELLTDGQIHDVGTGSASDKYEGFNTPSLKGVSLRLRLLHDGRATSLAELLTEHHRPEDVSGTDGLSDQQRTDLIEFLKTL